VIGWRQLERTKELSSEHEPIIMASNSMKKALHFFAGITALAGINIGFIMTLFFLYHKWGVVGVAVGFTFVPPLLICPIWEWVATGHWLTFFFVYVLGFGGFAACKFVEVFRSDL
jgi:hypothetical protein